MRRKDLQAAMRITSVMKSLDADIAKAQRFQRQHPQGSHDHAYWKGAVRGLKHAKALLEVATDEDF